MEFTELEELTKHLTRLLSIFEEDRSTALDNYNDFKSQLNEFINGDFEAEMSDGGELEKQVNKSLELVFKSSDKLNKVIETISKILITQLNNENREKVASILNNGGGFSLEKPANINQLKKDIDIERE